ncbi:MAG: hypothetical protein GY953_17970 [bacterium]|nr:hypothetical protein [bacterium]
MSGKYLIQLEADDPNVPMLRLDAGHFARGVEVFEVSGPLEKYGIDNTKNTYDVTVSTKSPGRNPERISYQSPG